MTEEEIRIRAITAILAGRTASYDYSSFSLKGIVSEAIWGADILIEELRKKKEAEENETS